MKMFYLQSQAESQQTHVNQQSCSSSAFPTSPGVSFTKAPTLCLSPGGQRLREQQNHHSPCWQRGKGQQLPQQRCHTTAQPTNSGEMTHSATGSQLPWGQEPGVCATAGLTIISPLPPHQHLGTSPAPQQQDRVNTSFRRRGPALTVKATSPSPDPSILFSPLKNTWCTRRQVKHLKSD